MNKKRYFLDPPVVSDYLLKGERFTKWSEESTKTIPVTMRMDPKGFYVYWINQSKETTFLDVATIRDTRTGKYAKLPKHPKVRNVFNLDFPDSNHLAKTLTIVSGPDTVNLTYHNFFASKDKVTQNWANDILGIAYNAARNNSCRQVLLDKIIYKMFPADKKRVESALASANLPKGKYDTIKPDVFTESAFKTFLTHLCPRPEIYEIFTSYSTKPTMTKENFTKFLNEKQRDSRLNEELFPRLRQDQIKALIDKYEPCSTNSNRGLISPEGLLFYLMGSETSVVMQDRLAKSQDMTQPIPHYFIKSSHNTYLTAGQFSGVSSPEMYRQCLLSGCRCLELDCWKGKPPDEEPIITHGFTMTTEILFKDVIEAIAESAFKTSQYPVILSFENHVDSVKQQEKMANYCKTIFGDALLTEPLEKYPLKPGQQIPSPSELLGKILIKNKKGSQEKPAQTKKTTASNDQTTTTAVPTQETNSTSEEPTNPPPAPQDNQAEGDAAAEETEEQEDTEEQDEEKMKTSDEGTAGQEVTAYEAMSSLVNYIQPNKFISFDNARKKNKSYVISSFVETKGEAMMAKNAVEFVEYPLKVLHMLTYCVQIYSGQFLSDKNVKTGVEVEVIGLPGDPKKKYRTKWTTTPNAINPVWNEEPFVFEKILLPEMASLRIVVHEENGKFVGHRIIPLDAIQSDHQALYVVMCLFFQSSSDYISPYELPLEAQPSTDKAKESEVAVAEASSEPPPEASADDSKTVAEDTTDTSQLAVEPPQTPDMTPAESPAGTTETLPEATPPPEDAEKEVAPEPEAATETTEELVNDSSTNPEPALDHKAGVEGAPVEPGAVVAPCLPSTSPESARPSDSSQPPTSSEDTNRRVHKPKYCVFYAAEPSTVTTEELTQHKNYLKVIKRQEREMKEAEKKNQKKGEDLIQKYSESFKTIKKKASVKKKDGGGNTADSIVKTERVQEQKEKMQVELQALWTEQCDQMKKRKEQFATERLAKLMELATERHISELKTLERLKRAMSTEVLDETVPSDGASSDYSPQQEALMKKQAATLEEIKNLTHQLNQEALKEHAQKLRSLPSEVKETVNVCVGAHFPEMVDQAGEKKVEGVGFYGDVFLG
ncbi:1-phosphatidylinositol 4,5-bisphosphate phosphodiesterase beta-2 [Channa argus]|uniref:1-phosphatidylinositol 4,5-bisphosphate phosphodiesterase n=1 Tax=Channa argus TaxID=215402 RepID=A0A6G1QFY9_CHAAH|nr:1-phosphatidylinositol 4,5-bisphosphate phosphodiesterase beta-2 [Channa argus]